MKNPIAIVQQLDAIRHQIAGTAGEIRAAEIAADDTDRDFKREFAVAYRRASGSIDDRKHQATLDVEEFAKARDRAATILNYAKTRRANLEIEQSNLQTQARLVDNIYRNGGA